MIYALCPRYSSRKSFYGKAMIEETENENVKDEKLYSYGTLVARYTIIGGIKNYFYFGHYSSTTTSHQKEFFKQCGLSDKEIKKIFKEGILKYETINNK